MDGLSMPRTNYLPLLLLFLAAVGWTQGEPTLEAIQQELEFTFTRMDEEYISGPSQGVFIKTAALVEIVLVANYSRDQEAKTWDIRSGYYLFNDKQRLNPLFTCGQESIDQSSISGLPASPRGPYLFDPGAQPFGLYVQSAQFNPAFSITDETVFSQDERNKPIQRFGNDIHKARIYPYQTKLGIRKNWYVLCWEISTDNDYQDLITVIRGVALLTPPPKKKRTQSLEGHSEAIAMP
jgi:hypothetical protein